MTAPGASLPVQEAKRNAFDWRKNVGLFLLTVVAVFDAGRRQLPGDAALWEGWTFAVPLLLILLFHEFGHFIAARRHAVPASLPYFIPIPLTLLGTLGAVIVMPDRIRSRNALLDIGAAGPLAGMVVAIPTMIIGLRLSPVLPQSVSGYAQEGQSLLYWALKRLTLGPIPPGYDVVLHPTALAAWAGFFLTLINLLPWGQLDGGHIAYALFGARQNRFARWVRRGLLLLFAYNAAVFMGPVLAGNSDMPLWVALFNSSFWLQWWVVTAVLGHLSGHDHPPVEAGELSKVRKRVALGSLVLFALLFMPTPFSIY